MAIVRSKMTECDDEHGDVALGIVEYAADCAPAAHVVGHDNEHGGQA